MTLLIAGGCSYTASDYHVYKKHNIETWPHLLAREYGYDLINTATGGYGNRWIMNSVIDAIMKNKDKEIVVAVTWSEPYRMSFIDDTDLDHAVFLFSDQQHEHRLTFSPGLARYFNFNNDARKEFIKYLKPNSWRKENKLSPIEKAIDFNCRLVSQSFKNIWYLQDFCDRHNITSYHMHTYNSVKYDEKLSQELYETDDVSKEALKAIQENMYFKLVQDFDNYMGYRYNFFNDLEKEGLWISDNNKINYHPNQKGHELMSKRFSDFMKTKIRLDNHNDDAQELWTKQK
tara:strand:- start:438 stop:1301 length:864 start_codon:yes stop_codon:yes gene_type:complete